MRSLTLYLFITLGLLFSVPASANEEIAHEVQQSNVFNDSSQSALVPPQDTTPQISCVFSWLEAKYPQYYAPASKNTSLLTYSRNSYRYYAKTDSLLVYNPTYDRVYSGYNLKGTYNYIDLGTLPAWTKGTGCSTPPANTPIKYFDNTGDKQYSKAIQDINGIIYAVDTNTTTHKIENLLLINPNKQSIKIVLDDSQRPSEIYVDDGTIMYFSNYTGTTFDAAISFPDGTIGNVSGVTINSSTAKRMNAAISTDPISDHLEAIQSMAHDIQTVTGIIKNGLDGIEIVVGKKSIFKKLVDEALVPDSLKGIYDGAQNVIDCATTGVACAPAVILDFIGGAASLVEGVVASTAIKLRIAQLIRDGDEIKSAKTCATLGIYVKTKEGLGVNNVNITINDKPIGSTNSNGFYELQNWSKGFVIVAISANNSKDFAPTSEKINLACGSNSKVFTVALKSLGCAAPPVRVGNLEVQACDYSSNGRRGFNWQEALTAASSYGSGWHLPTKDELNLLYKNKNVVGGFAVLGYYWSSTEYSSSSAWYQYFLTGHQVHAFNNNKNDSSHGVRSVRAF